MQLMMDKFDIRQMGGRYSTDEWLGSFRMLLNEYEKMESGAKDGGSILHIACGTSMREGPLF